LVDAIFYLKRIRHIIYTVNCVPVIRSNISQEKNY